MEKYTKGKHISFRKASMLQNHMKAFPGNHTYLFAFLLSNVLQIQQDSKQGYWILCHMVSSHQRCPKGVVSRGCPLFIYRGSAWQSLFAHSHKPTSEQRRKMGFLPSMPFWIQNNVWICTARLHNLSVISILEHARWGSTPSNYLFAFQFQQMIRWRSDNYIADFLHSRHFAAHSSLQTVHQTSSVRLPCKPVRQSMENQTTNCPLWCPRSP